MIVIPMAGRNNRFREAGYTTPGFMLTWRKKSLFFHALDSFRAHFATERFLIVLEDREGALSFVERELALLGIPRNKVAVIALEDAAKGQAEIVAAGLRKARVPPDAPLTVFNVDAHRKDFVHPSEFGASDVDGYLEVISDEGENRSFARPPANRSNERRAAEVSEKIRISDLRHTGLYHFRSCEFYLSLHAETEGLHPSGSRGGEHRVAALHDRAARRGADIRPVRVSSDDVRFFGTPAEYEQRLRETPSDNSLAFCIGGQIRKDCRHLEAIADFARERKADVYISVWRNRGRKTLLGAMGGSHMRRVFGRAAYFLPPGNLGEMFPDVERLLASDASEDCSAELREIFPDAMIDVEEDDVLDLAFDTKTGDDNSLRMLYKIWRCNRLKRAGEAARGRKYEGVARFRPDVLPSLDVFATAEMRPGTVIFKERNHPAGVLPDVFWLCPSETDDRLSNLFGKAVLGADRGWKGIHRELEAWIERLSLALKWDGLKIGVDQNAERDQALARSLACAALRNGRHAASIGLTRDDGELLADFIERSERPSAAGLTIDGLRSMYSAKRALVVVRGILISVLSVAKPPHEDPSLHHCADLILLTIAAESGWTRIKWDESVVRTLLGPFTAPFRKVAPDAEPLLRNTSDTKSDSPLGGLIRTVHRDLSVRLGEERFLTIARSIRDCR